MLICLKWLLYWTVKIKPLLTQQKKPAANQLRKPGVQNIKSLENFKKLQGDVNPSESEPSDITCGLYEDCWNGLSFLEKSILKDRSKMACLGLFFPEFLSRSLYPEMSCALHVWLQDTFHYADVCVFKWKIICLLGGGSLLFALLSWSTCCKDKTCRLKL